MNSGISNDDNVILSIQLLPEFLRKVEPPLQPKTVDLPSNFNNIFSQNTLIHFLMAVGIYFLCIESLT